MQISPRLFPHPVLSFFSDDLVGCQYQCAVSISPTGTTYQFDAFPKTSSSDLKILLSSGKASYAVHVECSRTRYREIFKWNTDKHQFHILSNLLDGKVNVCRFIVANEDIDEYKNENFHPDYNGFNFKVKKGDVLAIDTTFTFDADKEIDPLKSIPSIFRIRVSRDENAPPMDVDLSSDKVNIWLSVENYRKFKVLQLTQSLQPVLSQLVIVPVLVSILEKIQKLESDERLGYEDLRWYRVLVKKLADNGINPDDDSWPLSTISLVQKLIADPVSQSLDALFLMEED